MLISASTKLDDLLRAYPFLREHLTSISPKFGKLNNPILRRTVGRLATLGQAAGMADMPIPQNQPRLNTAAARQVQTCGPTSAPAQTG